jgi:predicted HTH domain antitoxin
MSQALKKIEFTLPVYSLTDTIQQEAEARAREAYIMTLLKYGEISSGRASQLLGIARLEIIELMTKYDISPFDDTMTLEEFQDEVKQAKAKLDSKKL